MKSIKKIFMRINHYYMNDNGDYLALNLRYYYPFVVVLIIVSIYAIYLLGVEASNIMMVFSAFYIATLLIKLFTPLKEKKNGNTG